MYPRTLQRTAFAGGLTFTTSWIIGLLIAPAGTDVTSSGAEVLTAIAPHARATAGQYVLTELVAAVALVATAGSIARYAATSPARAAADVLVGPGTADPRIATTARLLRRTAAVAGSISMLQGVLGLLLTLVAVPRGADHAAGLLFETINRADGAKMFVLAGLAVLGVRLGRLGALPAWLTPVAALLAVSIVVSGVGYLLLVSALSAAAYVSLPLLLVWVTGSGVAVAVAVGQRLHDGG